MELGFFYANMNRCYRDFRFIGCFVLFCVLLVFAGRVSSEPPSSLDFFGGYFEEGEYRCYSEPCFSINKGTEAAASRVRPFKRKEWLPKRGSKNACQQAYTLLLTQTSKVDVKYTRQNDCQYVVSGLWIDAYTGEKVDVSSIAIDHRISLKEAHLYGGSDWSRSKRLKFVYAMGNLIPVSASQKKSRNGRSASNWMPENKSDWCDYIVRRDIVTREFDLHIPKHEKEYNKKIKTLYCKY